MYIANLSESLLLCLQEHLPIKTFNYGPIESDLQKFEFKIGPLVCKGEKTIENLEIELHHLKSKVNANRVFFNAYGDSKQDDGGFESLIKFDVLLVETGVESNFNLNTGEFKVPIKGTYEFSFSAGSCIQPTDIGILKNEVTEMLLTNRGSSPGGHSPSQHVPISSNWLMNLNKNDSLQLKVLAGHVDTKSRMFTGKLLNYL